MVVRAYRSMMVKKIGNNNKKKKKKKKTYSHLGTLCLGQIVQIYLTLRRLLGPNFSGHFWLDQVGWPRLD